MSIRYTATAHIDGGRDGRARGAGGHPDLLMAPPPEMGGRENPEATNPEELFALGWGACFLSTLQFVARSRKVSAKQFTLDSEIRLEQVGEGFAMSATLDAQMPGVEQELGRELVEEAHGVCVYSKATRGNIEVRLRVNGEPV